MDGGLLTERVRGYRNRPKAEERSSSRGEDIIGHQGGTQRTPQASPQSTKSPNKHPQTPQTPQTPQEGTPQNSQRHEPSRDQEYEMPSERLHGILSQQEYLPGLQSIQSLQRGEDPASCCPPRSFILPLAAGAAAALISWYVLRPKDSVVVGASSYITAGIIGIIVAALIWFFF